MKIFKTIIVYLLIVLSCLDFALNVYLAIHFKDVTVEQILFSIMTSTGTSYDAIKDGVWFCVIGILIISAVLITIYFILRFFIKRKKFTKLFIFLPIKINAQLITSIIVFIISIVLLSIRVGLPSYIINQFHYSAIYEEHYVDPKTATLEFPSKKKNLIYIYLESFEMSGASVDNGGMEEESYIPHLEKLAQKHINFSHNDKLGGMKQAYGASWTAAAIIAQTAGVPLKVPSQMSNLYGISGASLPGAYTLGEILADHGYKNYFLMGSDKNFGGRGNYLEKHGNYTIYDYNYAITHSWIREDYHEWWGFEDAKLFERAKSLLLKMASKNKPFNFTMLTADTHFMDGYLDSSCPEKFDTHYANAFYCSDMKVSSFVNWVKKQSFYKDTVIIIVGDHYTMQTGFYEDEDNRSVYNVIINSNQKTDNTKNRIFTAFDMYPTTLAALGVKIKGNQLGLGVNLFSSKKTLAEELKLDGLDNELKLQSNYYADHILGLESYVNMVEEYKKNKD